MALNAHDENKLSLTNILGLGGEEAEELLSDEILLTYDKSDPAIGRLVHYSQKILSRTFLNVKTEVAGNPSVEIVFGNSAEISQTLHVFAHFGGLGKVIISDARPVGPSGKYDLHAAFQIVIACYVAAFTMRRLLGASNIVLPFPTDISLDFTQLFPDWTFLIKAITIRKAYLAGAGAIGNAFLYALQTFDVAGEILICDGDQVSGGNLNRCLWFNDSHVGENKAAILAQVAQPRFARLRIHSYQGILSMVPEKAAGGKWLERLIVAVDSRRARRSLNSEIPREVYDASTTDIREVFLHFNKRPLDGSACLECAYYLDAVEKAHERHVANALGVTVSDIEELVISSDAAARISEKYSEYKSADLTGQSYDSLFKELCGKGSIIGKDDAQVLAPFAFVSVLAGALLAIEFVRRIQSGLQSFNHFRMSPWFSPVLALRQLVTTNPKCSFCTDPVKADFAEHFWR